MGLFNRKKNADNGAAQSSPAPEKATESKAFKGTSIERDVTQAVALCMNSLHITEQPVLKFFYNDKGIFEGIYQSHMNNAETEAIRREYNDDAYLFVLGSHSLGVGAYVTLCQAKYKKPVDKFEVEEAVEISRQFQAVDPYELTIRTLGYAVDGNNKKCLDRIVMVGAQAYREAVGKEYLNKTYLKSYMQVLYNAGITLVMRK